MIGHTFLLYKTYTYRSEVQRYKTKDSHLIDFNMYHLLFMIIQTTTPDMNVLHIQICEDRCRLDSQIVHYRVWSKDLLPHTHHPKPSSQFLPEEEQHRRLRWAWLYHDTLDIWHLGHLSPMGGVSSSDNCHTQNFFAFDGISGLRSGVAAEQKSKLVRYSKIFLGSNDSVLVDIGEHVLVT